VPLVYQLCDVASGDVGQRQPRALHGVERRPPLVRGGALQRAETQRDGEPVDRALERRRQLLVHEGERRPEWSRMYAHSSAPSM